MRLCKYYSYKAGLKAIESRYYGFSEPYYFNDPFELTYLIDSRSPQKISPITMYVEILRRHVCILCLTKSPLNQLMWAHYGDSHKGFVVEYDVDDEFLTSTKYNLVPVQKGAVIYQEKNTHIEPPEFDLSDFKEIVFYSLGSNHDRTEDYSNIINYLYLTKSAIWAYENEVRIVKLVDSLFEETHVFLDDPIRSYKNLTRSIKDKPGCEIETQPGLKLFDKHKAKIVSIYIGVNNSLLKNKGDLRKKISKWKSEGVENIFHVQPDESSWELRPVSLSTR